MSGQCPVNHDWFNATLTFGLCCGLIISYAPQHFRIAHKGSSEGFSPWFLLLGCTSAAAGFFNLITVQWNVVKCCRIVSFGYCTEITAGIVQIGLQWALFNLIYVLFIIYYPAHLKYIPEAPSEYHSGSSKPLKLKRTSEWNLSIVLAWIVLWHLFVVLVGTVFVLTLEPSPVNSPLPESVRRWATFLGVTAAGLAAIQYAPQLVHTYKMKVVGALSIPMMMIQSPGAVLMVLSIALRPSTNWTSWITFAVAGIMQGSLLVMCILWKFRQRRLGIDDFGHPLVAHAASTAPYNDETQEVPGLVVGDEDPVAVTNALANALETAVEEDVRTDRVKTPLEIPVTEQTSLLRPTKRRWRLFG